MLMVKKLESLQIPKHFWRAEREKSCLQTRVAPDGDCRLKLGGTFLKGQTLEESTQILEKPTCSK